MDRKRLALMLVTVAALIAGVRNVAHAAPPQRQSTLSLATGRTAISHYAANLRDAVAGMRPDAPMQAEVQDCRKRQGVVTCMASWTFAEVRCAVEVNAVADHGVLVEELGEATCRQRPPRQPGV